jgi:hypothetical protein
MILQAAKEKNRATFGWEAFTAEANYKAYNKRLEKLPGASSGSSSGSSSGLNYGQTSSSDVSKNGLNRMVSVTCLCTQLPIYRYHVQVIQLNTHTPTELNDFLSHVSVLLCYPPLHLLSQVNEIEGQELQREKFSRRRTAYEGTTIDHISDKNEFFNKKIKRAFDKYTVEIRQNFERGTAL